MRAVIIWAFIFTAGAFLKPLARAGEHPTEHPAAHEHPSEHPSEHPKKEKHEHPKKGRHEHPEKGEHKGAKKAVTVNAVAKAVERHVRAEAKKEDGWFHVHDKVTGKDLRLRLKKIHKKRLSRLEKGKFFVCADFTADDKTVYDLDMFAAGKDAAKLKIYDVTVHKVGGKPRYGWAEKDGNWTRVPVE